MVRIISHIVVRPILLPVCYPATRSSFASQPPLFTPQANDSEDVPGIRDPTRQIEPTLRTKLVPRNPVCIAHQGRTAMLLLDELDELVAPDAGLFGQGEAFG